AVGQASGLNRAIADNVGFLVHDIDEAFLGDRGGDKVVRVEGRRVRDEIMLHHLEIDRILLLQGGYPSARLPAVAGHAENEIVAFANKPVSRGADRHRSAVDRYRDRAGKQAEAGIDHVVGAVDLDREEHVRSYALMTWCKQNDAGRVPDGLEA